MFRFKKFDILQEVNAQKVGTDSMILGAWISKLELSPKNVLDIGTGTGVLALMAAQVFPEALVHAIEIDQNNHEEAELNFVNSSFNDRISSSCIPLNNYNPECDYDLIISNPPYFRNSLKSGKREIDTARHDTEMSMEDLVLFLSDKLNLKGVGAVVYPSLEEDRFIKLIKGRGLFLVKCLRTIHKGTYVRSFMLVSRVDHRSGYEELSVRNSSNDYSAEYIELTKEFHFNKL